MPTVARHYGTTRRVEVGGVTFEIGWIPQGVFKRILFTYEAARNQALRRTLIRLRREHAEDGTAAEPTPEEVQHAAILDVAHLAEADAIEAEMVAWGIRSHAGLKDETGTEVPFEAEVREYLGEKFQGASERMVHIYADADLLRRLYVEVAKRNSIAGDAKKNSEPPSPSEPTPGGGSASIA